MDKNELGYICFDRLWETLAKRKHNQQWLINNGVHRATIYKLKDNKNVNCEVIIKLCYLLNCQPKDIMEYVKEPKEG